MTSDEQASVTSEPATTWTASTGTLIDMGAGLRPDGKQAGTLIPPAFGLAGVNLHTWTGFGSVPYWNAYVGATEMHGSGTFFDARLSLRRSFRSPPGAGRGTRVALRIIPPFMILG